MRDVDLRPFLTDAAIESWAGVDALVQAIGTDHWTLAGGQMVMVHLASSGIVTSHRATADADLAVDVRAGGSRAMTEMVEALLASGFAVEVSADGVTRFARGSGRIDLLAPEGLGRKAATVAGGHAIAAPGATQALSRSETVRVTWSDSTTTLRCPTLFGALVAKAAAATGTNEGAARRQRHLDDVVALAAAMARVGPGSETPSAKDLRRIRSAYALLTEDNPAWLVTDQRTSARSMLDELVGG